MRRCGLPLATRRRPEWARLLRTSRHLINRIPLSLHPCKSKFHRSEKCLPVSLFTLPSPLHYPFPIPFLLSHLLFLLTRFIRHLASPVSYSLARGEEIGVLRLLVGRGSWKRRIHWTGKLVAQATTQSLHYASSTPPHSLSQDHNNCKTPSDQFSKQAEAPRLCRSTSIHRINSLSFLKWADLTSTFPIRNPLSLAFWRQIPHSGP